MKIKCHCSTPSPWSKRKLNGICNIDGVYLVQRTCLKCNATMSRRVKKLKVDFIVCFRDGTWSYHEEDISEALFSRRDREEVENRYKDILELEYKDKGLVAFFLSHFGPEDR